MERIGTLADLFIEDVNKENSTIINFFNIIVNSLFKVFSIAGIPFFLYVLIQFANKF